MGDGICVGIDCVKDLLKVDAKYNVKIAGFDTGKDAPAASLIRLCAGDIAAPSLLSNICKTLNLPPAYKFHVITGLWVFDLLPTASRIPALRQWASMLKPGGRIVLHLSLLVEGTECPASFTTACPGLTTALPNGSSARARVVKKQTKIAPPEMWLMCRKQVRELAQQCGLSVVSMQDLASRNDNHGGEYEDVSNSLLTQFHTAWMHERPGTGYTPSDNAQWLQGVLGKLMQVSTFTGEDVYWKNVAVFVTLRRLEVEKLDAHTFE